MLTFSPGPPHLCHLRLPRYAADVAIHYIGCMDSTTLYVRRNDRRTSIASMWENLTRLQITGRLNAVHTVAPRSHLPCRSTILLALGAGSMDKRRTLPVTGILLTNRF
jgi:hypothetical protein